MSDSPWITALVRGLHTHGATVLHGRVADHLPDAKHLLRPVPQWLHAALCGKDQPVRHMVVVDPAGRLTFPKGSDAQAFARAWQGSDAGDADDSADDYLGDDFGEPTAPAQVAVADLLTVIAQRPADFAGWLVVVDFAHLTAADASRLQAEERALALAGSQYVRAAAGEALAGKTAPHLVWVTRALGQLPTALYLGDPRVHLVAVPEPSLAERRAWLTRHQHSLRCAAAKPAPGDRRPDRVLTVEALAELTDGQSFVDLAQIIALSKTTAEPLTPDALLNLYRYGDQRSPWEELDEAKVRDAAALLAERVYGQPEAVEHVAAMIRRAWLGLSGLQHSARNTAPKGKLFFVGPTGVGKTELAKGLAFLLFGDERACLRFDMSEYNHEHSDQRLVGAPPGYVGFEQGGQLTNAVRARPFSVLLFDEIEKAHGRILDKFLQILEDGRLTDGRGETAWFGETVILFTSNLGAADMPKGADDAALADHFRGAVERHFNEKLGRPELLNRLGDHIVPFARVTDAEVRRKLLDRKLTPIVDHLHTRFGVRLRLTDAAKARLVAQARTDHGGRGLLNAIERALLDPLTAWLMECLHQLRAGRVLVADASDAGLTFELIDA